MTRRGVPKLDFVAHRCPRTTAGVPHQVTRGKTCFAKYPLIGTFVCIFFFFFVYKFTIYGIVMTSWNNQQNQDCAQGSNATQVLIWEVSTRGKWPMQCKARCHQDTHTEAEEGKHTAQLYFIAGIRGIHIYYMPTNPGGGKNRQDGQPTTTANTPTYQMASPTGAPASPVKSPT